MKPKNSTERRNAFLKFLALFLVTLLTVVYAVYFNYKIPVKENALLKEKVKQVETEMAFQNKFTKEMKAIKAMIDSLDVKGQNIPYQKNLISARLVDLQKTIPANDSTINYDMYDNIIKLYVEMQETKGEILSLNDAKNTISEYKLALDRCQNNLKQTERNLLIARSGN